MPNTSDSSSNTATNTVVQFPKRPQDISKPYALIIGINGSIGNAIAKELSTTHQVVGLARDIHNANHNFTLVQSDYSELHLAELTITLLSISEKYAVIVNCIGLLHNTFIKPEKKLEQISEKGLSNYFYVNATLPALLIKHFQALLPKDKPSVYANLSAMVGSIKDNRMGGWYGYRASKAALNMLTKTAAIELARSHKKTALIALHPGTTQSKLSAPFTKTRAPEKLYTPELTAKRLVKVIKAVDASQSGQFFHWSGKELDW